MQVPAAWVVVGLVVAAYGLVPRLVPAGWAALVLFLLVGELGPLLGLPAWAMDLSRSPTCRTCPEATSAWRRCCG